jgi:hypothetical protein
MSKYVNISELAEQVLADTPVPVKTAAATTKEVCVPAARELKKFAEDLRELAADESEPSDEDLAALMQDQEVQELLQALEENPELLEQLLAEDAGETEDAEAPEVPPEDEAAAEGVINPAMDPAAMPPTKMGSVSQELRKIAASLRKNAPKNRYIRRVKAAQMLQAATSIKHLLGA